MEEKQKVLLSDEKLKEAIETLQDLIEACKEKLDGKTFSAACRKRNLNPAKTRLLILSTLENCRRGFKPLAEADTTEMYDGCECFYHVVFGERTMGWADLPYDYQESVKYVIENAGLNDQEMDVLKHRYGIDGSLEPKTIRDVGEIMGFSGSRAQVIELNALQKCRRQPFRDVLKYGLTLYAQMKEQKKEEQELKLRQVKEKHKAMINALQAEHEREIRKLIAADDWKDLLLAELYEIPVTALNLSTRPRRALTQFYPNPACSLGDLLKYKTMEDLMRIPRMGRNSAKEVLEEFNFYLEEHYEGLTLQKLQRHL